MKIIVDEKPGLVTSVHASAGRDRMDVLVNTSKRWVKYHRQGSSPNVEYDQDLKGFPVHQYFVIEDDSGIEVGVTLIAENDFERSSLEWPVFTSQEKDQIHLVFLQYIDSTEVALWRPGKGAS